MARLVVRMVEPSASGFSNHWKCRLAGVCASRAPVTTPPRACAQRSSRATWSAPRSAPTVSDRALYCSLATIFRAISLAREGSARRPASAWLSRLHCHRRRRAWIPEGYRGPRSRSTTPFARCGLNGPLGEGLWLRLLEHEDKRATARSICRFSSRARAQLLALPPVTSQPVTSNQLTRLPGVSPPPYSPPSPPIAAVRSSGEDATHGCATRAVSRSRGDLCRLSQVALDRAAC